MNSLKVGLMLEKIKFLVEAKDYEVAHCFESNMCWKFINYIASTQWESEDKKDITDMAQLMLMSKQIEFERRFR